MSGILFALFMHGAIFHLFTGRSLLNLFKGKEKSMKRVTVFSDSTEGGDQSHSSTGTGLMDSIDLIEQELATAEAAKKIGNDGKARVCARRAVALADDAWLGKRSAQTFRGDALAHLGRIQQDHSLPLSIREAAERLSTAVTQKDSAPFSTDPIGDARIIIGYLTPN